MSIKRKILLLNPPGDKLYLRDYYCSHSSKAKYYWHPYDLLAQSGFLAQEHEVQALDSIVTGLSPQDSLDRIMEMDIDTIFFLTGGVSWRNDFEFVQSVLKAKPQVTQVIATGDIFLSRSTEILEKNPFLNAALMDFTSDVLLRYFRGELQGEKTDYITYRYNGQILEGRRYTEQREFEMPIQRLELFPWKKYRIPHGRYMPFGSTLTNFGCPFKCSFCVSSIVPLKLRKPENAVAEIEYLHKNFGIKEFWFKDFTFAVNKKQTTEFLNLLISKNLDLSWVCLSRVDVVDEETIQLMSKAGCHTIQFGVESASNEILKHYQKGVKPDQVRTIFKYCREHGIRTLAHFIIGLPGETRESAQLTIDFAKELLPDFVSFNIATPKMGTPFRKEAVEKGWTSSEVDVLDNSVAFPVVQTSDLTPEEIWKLRNHAIRSYHLQPRFIWLRLSQIKTFYEFSTLIREGLGLLASTFHPMNAIPEESDAHG